MKNQTARLIENMKKQTIGVEVEMNSITRQTAAKVAADFFGTGRCEYTASRNGYRTWSAWDSDGREWKFSRDASIDGPEEEKCELVTPILHYQDIELLQGLVRALRKAGAKSDFTRTCGVHVHVGASGHTARSLRNLVNMMASHQWLLWDSLKIASARSYYCQMVDRNFLKQLNNKKPETMAELADIWYKSQDASYDRNCHYNSTRYHMLNLHATFTKGTVEFRMFQFYPADAEGKKKNGIHAGRLKAYIQLCLAMNEFAKESRKATCKPVQQDNPKFAMKSWLFRLGLVGKEFYTARRVFLDWLEGDVAYRHPEERAA